MIALNPAFDWEHEPPVDEGEWQSEDEQDARIESEDDAA